MLRRALGTEQLEMQLDPKLGRDTRTGRARFGDQEFEISFRYHHPRAAGYKIIAGAIIESLAP
jgi:hypothetical protein